MINDVTIGADPEVFFVNRKTNIPQSAEGLCGGDKWHPVQMEGLPEGFMIQEDNVTAEFNIPPAKTADQFSKNIFLGLRYVTAIARNNKLKVHLVPDLDFPKEQLITKHCQTLGCNPDFNAWTEQENPAPVAPEFMRTAAGHIHIGWNKPTWSDVMLVAKGFDLFVTVPSIIITEPNRRRQLYGRAGSCRPKQYGVECRSLDNFWLSKKRYIHTIFYNIQEVIDTINEDREFFLDIIDDYSDIIIDCINNHDKKAAQFLCDKFDITNF